jgi:hypothetical protein
MRSTGRTHACAGGANDALTAYEIPWGTNEIRAAQVDDSDRLRPDPPPAEGVLISMLCQIVG